MIEVAIQVGKLLFLTDPAVIFKGKLEAGLKILIQSQFKLLLKLKVEHKGQLLKCNIRIASLRVKVYCI